MPGNRLFEESEGKSLRGIPQANVGRKMQGEFELLNGSSPLRENQRPRVRSRMHRRRHAVFDINHRTSRAVADAAAPASAEGT